MRINSEIKDHIARHSTKFLLADWCSPESLNLNETQICNLLLAIEAQLLPHLAAAKQLILSLQASTDSPRSGCKLASVQVYSLYSNTALMNFNAKIVGEDLTLKVVETRPLANIRKSSLHGNNKTTIIIVDDDPVIIKTITRWINADKPEYEILAAGNASDGIKLYQANFHCSCIYMDIQMPGMNGIEASECIREFECANELKCCPIIFMSADISLKAKLLDIPNSTFCTKPLKIATCLDAMAVSMTALMLESCSVYSPK